MHIPDGYLSPLFSLATGAATVPVWALAGKRVQKVLNNRTVPLLAVFSAFSFTIMMFNIPVPGGTTAHGVGGTLIALVLGPWAAVIGVSMALILQALFFGDGGVLAIFANCLNMGIILPFVGYYTYKLIAGRSDSLSPRRIWAAGIGAYVGITASAIAVGIELGLQPLLFTENGRPLYSPYDLGAALPAMIISHLFGASLVEGLITALGMAYLQKQHPEYLTSLRKVVAGPDVATGQAVRRPFWQVAAVAIGAVLVVIIAAGLIEGGGNPARFFGADWSQVRWPDVASMLLVTAIIAAVLIPLTWVVLPKSLKRVGTAFTALAVLAPLGLIAPGFAFGEGSAEDVHAAFGYVPTGLEQFSRFFSAPLAGYNIPLPFFSDANAPLWQAAVGYEISGIIGILLLGGLVWGLASLLRRGRSGGEVAPTPQTEPR
jgi:cobalt/nickel transport system permease protein